jgi:hypothetical protein
MINEISDNVDPKKAKKKKKMKNYLKKLEREKKELEIKRTFGLDIAEKIKKKPLK